MIWWEWRSVLVELLLVREDLEVLYEFWTDGVFGVELDEGGRWIGFGNVVSDVLSYLLCCGEMAVSGNEH